MQPFDINSHKALSIPRRGQIEILPKIIDAFNNKNKKFVILEAPTGAGKCLAGNQKIKIKISKKLDEFLKQRLTQ